VVGIPAKDGTMSEPVVTMVLVALLLPAAVTPPLMSLVEPVVSVSGEVPTAVGVPVTVQVMTAPMARVPVVGTVGEHKLLKPAGKPAIAQLVLTLAAAVAAGAVLVQVKVPLYGTPTCAVVGIPAKEGTMSEPVVTMELVTVLLPPLVAPPLTSLAAPVVKDNGAVPTAVGVPLTVQVMAAPIAKGAVVGRVGEQTVVKPVANPVMAQVAPALAAAVAAGAVFVQVKVPLYGTPTCAVVGIPAKEGTMSEPVVTMELVTVLLPPFVAPPLTSLAAPVVKDNGAVPTAVGVPLTVQVIAAPTATVAKVGTAGKQAVVKPVASPVIAQVAPILAAAVAAGAVLVQVKVPL
jgi:hypothetical protein